MNIIYLQGWDEKFNKKKFEILSKYGDKVLYPDINYQKSKNIISNFVNSDNAYSLIIGSSIGAYMAFYISNLVNRPSLLFNPTFFLKNGTDILPCNEILSYNGKNKRIKIILSLKDEKLNFNKTLQYLNSLELSEEIKIYNESCHDIPLDIFEKEFDEFRNKYIKKDIIEEKKYDDHHDDWWTDKIKVDEKPTLKKNLI